MFQSIQTFASVYLLIGILLYSYYIYNFSNSKTYKKSKVKHVYPIVCATAWPIIIIAVLMGFLGTFIIRILKGKAESIKFKKTYAELFENKEEERMKEELREELKKRLPKGFFDEDY